MILLFVCFIYRITSCISSFLVEFGKRVAFVFVSYGGASKVEVLYEATNHEVPSIVSEILLKSTCLPVYEGKVDSGIYLCGSIEREDGYEKCKSSWLHEYLNSDLFNSSALWNDSDMISDQSELSTRPLSSSSMDQDFDFKTKIFEEPKDSWHQSFEGTTSSSEILLPRSTEMQASEGDMNGTVDFLPQSADIQLFVAVIPSAPFEPDTPFIHEPDYFEFSSPAANLSADYEHLLTFPNSDVFVVSTEQPLVHSSVGNNGDSFHEMYKERMRFYDVLYQERLYGISEYLR